MDEELLKGQPEVNILVDRSLTEAGE